MGRTASFCKPSADAERLLKTVKTGSGVCCPASLANQSLGSVRESVRELREMCELTERHTSTHRGKCSTNNKNQKILAFNLKIRKAKQPTTRETFYLYQIFRPKGKILSP